MASDASDEQRRRITIPLTDCPVRSVTVYNDRAEVTRELTLSAPTAGAYELVVEDITAKCDQDSVRVKPTETSVGRVTIVEVAYEVHSKVISDAADDGGVEGKRTERVALVQKEAALHAELARLSSGRDLIAGYVKGVLMPPTPKSGDAAATVPSLEQVDELLQFFSDRTATSDTTRLRLDKELADVRAEIEIVDETLRRLQAPAQKRTRTSRDVTVLVNVGDGSGGLATPVDDKARVAAEAVVVAVAAPVTMLLTYVVSGASWSPSYDVRVDTSGAKGAALTLSYFGLVVNASGEDWLACRLSLSTAQPSKAGMPPAPPRRMLRWQDEQPLLGSAGVWGAGGGHQQRMRRGSTAKTKPACRSLNAAMPMQARMDVPMQARMDVPLQRRPSFSAAELEDDVDDLASLEEVAEPYMMDEVETASVAEGGGGTATFHIERVVSIEKDAKPHKVTVALLNFEPSLMYFATPTLEPAFYLQLRTKNTSSFPLLASSKVSVFLDGSFMCTTSLKDVAPSEEFTTFLGADAAIKLEHQVHARERKAASFMSKTQSTTHRYTTKLHNTKAVPARLTVVEVLPKATEDRIKVELLAPSPRELKDEGSKEGKGAEAAETVQQNKVTNNIVWQIKLAPGEKRSLQFEYTVSWPTDKTLASYDYEG